MYNSNESIDWINIDYQNKRFDESYKTKVARSISRVQNMKKPNRNSLLNTFCENLETVFKNEKVDPKILELDSEINRIKSQLSAINALRTSLI